MPALDRRPATVLLAALLALLLAGCPGSQSDKKGADKGKDAPVNVITEKAELRPWQQTVEGIATLRAEESVIVTAAASAHVVAVLFREGTRVAAGTPLVRLESGVANANRTAAQVNLDTQQARFDRAESLRKKGLISQDELDTQAQALKDAQSRLELARVELEDRMVTAPFAGLLGFRQVSPGAQVEPGTPIVSLDATDTLRAEFQVPETLVAALTPGMTVEAQSAAYPRRIFKGVVTLTGSRVDEATRTLAVQARIDNRDQALKPGMLLTIRAQAKPRQALFVPEAAIVPEGTKQYVWRVDAKNVATRVEVSLGEREPGSVEITAGLAAGERIVREGQGNLRPGKIVKEH